MKLRLTALLAALCIFLCGCDSLLDGEFVSVQPHKIQSDSGVSDQTTAANYRELRIALARMVASGTEKGLIYVPEYPQQNLQSDIDQATSFLKTYDPITAYAVDNFVVVQGTSGGVAALDVDISYLHGSTEIRNIQQADSMEDAMRQITEALKAFDVSIVLHVANYAPTDFVQVVESYAAQFPQYVIEQPLVSVNVYPEIGTSRVVELKFSYQTSRDALKDMQVRVRNMFSSASLYVTGAEDANEKYSLLYTFIMERFDYTVETSITPAYSLLLHGVGDSRAFATVYAAMCAQAGLECYVVPGTHAGNAYYWNIVEDNGSYYHVDLLRCSAEGDFQKRLDADMTGYVWDYSAYPACTAPEVPVPTE